MPYAEFHLEAATIFEKTTWDYQVICRRRVANLARNALCERLKSETTSLSILGSSKKIIVEASHEAGLNTTNRHYISKTFFLVVEDK